MATTNYYLTLTDYGQQRLAAASAGLQTVQLKSLVLGDANNQPYDPASRTGFNALVNQKASVALSGITVKGGRTDIEAVIPIELKQSFLLKWAAFESMKPALPMKLAA